MTSRLDIPSTRWSRRWPMVLIGIFFAALAVRTVNVLVWYPTCDLDIIEHVESRTTEPYPECPDGEYRIWGDAGYSYLQGYLLSEGHGFADGFTWFRTGGTTINESAGDPPLYAVWAAGMFKVGLRSGEAQRLANGVLGAFGITLIAMVAARVGGRRAGAIAGLLGAAYPLLWINDAMLLSEGMYVEAVAAVLLVAYRFSDRPSIANAAILGGAIGMSTLVRGEIILLLGVLVVPLLLRTRDWSWRQRALGAGAAWLVGIAVLVPWIAYNHGRFEEPVYLTSQTGAVFSAGSCDVAFYGEALGYYAADCYSDYVRRGYPVGDPRMPGCTAEAAAAIDAIDPVEKSASDVCWPDPRVLDESQRDRVINDFGVRYIKEHASRFPVVAAARVGRMFDVYNPDIGAEVEPLGANVRLNWAVEGRGKRASELGFLFYWALVPLAVAGTVALRRRRLPLAPLLALPAVIAVTAAIAMGITRYRVPVDVVLVILAGVGLDAGLRRGRPVHPLDDATVRPVGHDPDREGGDPDRVGDPGEGAAGESVPTTLPVPERAGSAPRGERPSDPTGPPPAPAAPHAP